jgi:formamidopyrimidine-DNA glycosylase
MPELPEVQTTVSGLHRLLPGLKITDVWSDLPVKNQRVKHYRESVKDLGFYNMFKKEVIGTKVTSVERRAKNILINLNNGKTILIHLKMTGHIMVGRYAFDAKQKTWIVHKDEKNEALRDPFNKFIHFVLVLSNGKHMAMSDTRKFGKITLLDTKDAHETTHLSSIGPEPLDKKFTLEVLKERLSKKPNGKIKTVLMDQSVIAGIGNIYSDEILWLTGIHPEERVNNIPKIKLPIMHKAIKDMLAKGIDFGGDSMSDYRNVDGERGDFQNHHNAYRRAGKKCNKKLCGGIIIRKVVGGRSAHFCSKHQKLIAK